MSLINEALKRAKEAQNQPPTQAPSPAPRAKVSDPAMRPVEAKPQSGSPAVYILSTALVFVLLGAVVLLWLWSNSNSKPVVPEPSQMAQATKPAETVVPVPSEMTPQPIAKPVSVVTAAEQPAVSIPTPAVPPPVEPAQTPIPETAPLAAPIAETVATPASEPAPAPEPVAPAIPQFPTLKLQGIFYNPVNPAVVINGKTYSVGGVISGARITKIESDKVTVEWNDETRVLETAQ